MPVCHCWSIFTKFRRKKRQQNILSNSQFGFRKTQSTTASLLSATSNWLLNIDKSRINGVLLQDLRLKSYNCVELQREQKKWFISYFEKRYQICKVNNVKSSKKLIECGVPQGLNLGPLLFSLYANALPNCLDQTKP